MNCTYSGRKDGPYYCVMWVMENGRGSREGFGTQPWLNSISCAIPFIPLHDCGVNFSFCMEITTRLNLFLILFLVFF